MLCYRREKVLFKTTKLEQRGSRLQISIYQMAGVKFLPRITKHSPYDSDIVDSANNQAMEGSSEVAPVSRPSELGASESQSLMGSCPCFPLVLCVFYEDLGCPAMTVPDNLSKYKN